MITSFGTCLLCMAFIAFALQRAFANERKERMLQNQAKRRAEGTDNNSNNDVDLEAQTHNVDNESQVENATSVNSDQAGGETIFDDEAEKSKVNELSSKDILEELPNLNSEDEDGDESYESSAENLDIDDEYTSEDCDASDSQFKLEESSKAVREYSSGSETEGSQSGSDSDYDGSNDRVASELSTASHSDFDRLSDFEHPWHCEDNSENSADECDPLAAANSK